MLELITQHPVLSIIAFIVLVDYAFSTIRLFVWRGRVKSMSATFVNGKTYRIPGCHSISVINNKVFVDGKLYKDPEGENSEDGELTAECINISVEGNVTGDVVNESGDIKCGNVTGDVSTASGDIKANSIKGSCRTISGDISTN